MGMKNDDTPSAQKKPHCIARMAFLFLFWTEILKISHLGSRAICTRWETGGENEELLNWKHTVSIGGAGIATKRSCRS